MKKLVALFVIVAAFLSLNNSTFSQPQIILHLTGGYNVPLPDLKGDLTDSADNQNTFGIKQGFGFGIDGKYYLGKKRNVGITFGVGYQLFSNSEDTSQYLGKDVKNNLNALTVGLGVEYAFLPKGKANPFIGAEFTGHFFSGNFEFTTLGVTTKADLESASRFGAAFGAGVDIALNKNVGIIVGGKYHLGNLIGKDYDSTSAGDNKYRLTDKEYTVGNTTIEAKNISYIQLYLGLSLYLNQPKKMVKK